MIKQKGDVLMARPVKSRKVCRLPLCRKFYGGKGNDSGIVLTVEEYETIRLIDYMGFSQEECARQMDGSREMCIRDRPYEDQDICSYCSDYRRNDSSCGRCSQAVHTDNVLDGR